MDRIKQKYGPRCILDFSKSKEALQMKEVAQEKRELKGEEEEEEKHIAEEYGNSNNLLDSDVCDFQETLAPEEEEGIRKEESEEKLQEREVRSMELVATNLEEKGPEKKELPIQMLAYKGKQRNCQQKFRMPKVRCEKKLRWIDPPSAPNEERQIKGVKASKPRQRWVYGLTSQTNHNPIFALTSRKLLTIGSPRSKKNGSLEEMEEKPPDKQGKSHGSCGSAIKSDYLRRYSEQEEKGGHSMTSKTKDPSKLTSELSCNNVLNVYDKLFVLTSFADSRESTKESVYQRTRTRKKGEQAQSLKDRLRSRKRKLPKKIDDPGNISIPVIIKNSTYIEAYCNQRVVKRHKGVRDDVLAKEYNLHDSGNFEILDKRDDSNKKEGKRVHEPP